MRGRAPARGRSTARRRPRARPRAEEGPEEHGSPSQRARASMREVTPPRLVMFAIERGRGLDPARGVGVGDVEREEAAEARVANDRHRRVPAEALDDVLRRRGLPREAHLQRLETAEDEPCGVGRGHGAGARPELQESRRVLGAAADERADEGVVVSGEVLRRRVEDDVAAVLERAHVEGRRGRRVAHDPSRMSGGGLEVRQREERVRRRLEPDEVDRRRAAGRSGRTRPSRCPSGRARRASRPCRSRRPPRARRSARARAARGRATSPPRSRRRRAAPRRRRARRGAPRPPRSSGSRSGST